MKRFVLVKLGKVGLEPTRGELLLVLVRSSGFLASTFPPLPYDPPLFYTVNEGKTAYFGLL